MVTYCWLLDRPEQWQSMAMVMGDGRQKSRRQRMQHTQSKAKDKRSLDLDLCVHCACGPSRRSVHVVKFEEVAVAIAHCPISAIWNFLVRTINEGIGTLKVGVHFPPEVWEKKDAQKERRYEMKMAGRKDMRNWREEISTIS